MRILFLVSNLTNQGTYWRAFHLGRQLVKAGHELTLVATSHELRKGLRESEVDGVRLVEAPDLFAGALRRSGLDAWNTLNRIVWLRKQSFDLMHAFESRPTVIFPALYLKKRQPEIPLIMDWCDWFGRGGSVEERPNRLVRAALRPVETYFEEHFRRRADGTTVICSALGERAQQLGVKPDTIQLIRNGADTESFTPGAALAARQELNLEAQADWIGYVGTIFQRDALLMAKAFDRVLELNPKARLLITGYCPTDLRKLVQQPQAVMQTGAVEQARLLQYLAACDLFWLPLNDTQANRGRFPMKLTDYMAVGRPIVATAVGDIPAVFAGQAIGALSAAEPEAFAQATVRILNDPAAKAQLGQNARKAAEEHFQWATISNELDRFYQKILEATGR